MQDKSPYSNNNTPQISNDLQNYINEMVNEIIVSRGDFDDQKKKILRKVVEREGFEYDTLEKNLFTLFKTFEQNKNNCSDSAREKVKMLSKNCFLIDVTTNSILNKMKSSAIEIEEDVINNEKEDIIKDKPIITKENSFSREIILMIFFLLICIGAVFGTFTIDPDHNLILWLICVIIDIVFFFYIILVMIAYLNK